VLVTGDELLRVAQRNAFAVPAFNVSDYAMSNGLFELCEEKQAPMLIAIHPDELKFIGNDVICAIREQAHQASFAVGIHLDHGGSFEQVITAIRAGFTSVMIDGSQLSFEENIAATKKVVEAAHDVGVSVEGELGTIGSVDPNSGENGAEELIYTRPEDAVRFVAETGVDSLAIAIGTRHGIYPAGRDPKLKLDLLKEIRSVVSIPLVLHGGSDNPDAEIAQAVQLGICKVNISTDIKVAYFTKLREVLRDPAVREPNVIAPPAVAAMKVVAAHKIELFNAGDKARCF